MENSVSNKNNSKTNKLGTEPIPKLLISMAIPTVAAQLVNLLYNVVDRAFVGHIAGSGSLALAGLGIFFPIVLLISAFAVLVGMGGAPRAAIAMGGKDYEKAEKILGNCFTMLMVLSVVIFSFFMAIREPLLMAFGASSATLPYASAYMTTYLFGTVFVMITVGLNTFITNQGFARTSMATVCIGASLNIILDPIFIFGLDMGVFGAALATVISQGVSAIWVLVFLFGKRATLKIKRSRLKLDKRIVMVILSLGMSPFIMNVTECVVQLTYNICISDYGDSYVALQSILFTLIQIIWMPMSGFAQGATPLISFNYGAGKYGRARQAFKLLFILDMMFAIIVVGLVELFPGAILGIFTDNAALIAMGIQPMRVYLFGMILMGAQGACQQTFLALGQAKISIFLATLRKMLLIWPLALILPHLWGLGVWGLFLAEPIADLIAGTVTTTVFHFKSKKLLGQSENQQ